MNDTPVIEVCVDSLESARAAEEAGANRIELCQALFEGGLTPSAGLLESVRKNVCLEIAVMIRPRGGDFCYTEDEFEVMKRDLVWAKTHGAELIVLGVLEADGTIHRERTRMLCDLAAPLPVTFHRAFDMTVDPRAALETLIDLGAERVLTSGQERTALEGLDLIAELVRQAGDRIIVMPGGGLSERNLAKVLRISGAREFHVSASSTRESAMAFRNPRVAMGQQLGPPEYQVRVASAHRIRALRELAARAGGGIAGS